MPWGALSRLSRTCLDDLVCKELGVIDSQQQAQQQRAVHSIGSESYAVLLQRFHDGLPFLRRGIAQQADQCLYLTAAEVGEHESTIRQRLSPPLRHNSVGQQIVEVQAARLLTSTPSFVVARCRAPSATAFQVAVSCSALATLQGRENRRLWCCGTVKDTNGAEAPTGRGRQQQLLKSATAGLYLHRPLRIRCTWALLSSSLSTNFWTMFPTCSAKQYAAFQTGRTLPTAGCPERECRKCEPAGWSNHKPRCLRPTRVERNRETVVATGDWADHHLVFLYSKRGRSPPRGPRMHLFACMGKRRQQSLL